MVEAESVTFSIKNHIGKVVSCISCHYYGNGFGWVLLSDADTDASYRNMGYMTNLLRKCVEYSKSKGCGAYLVVEAGNRQALELYIDFGFTEVKRQHIGRYEYIVMAYGERDFKDLLDCTFS